MTGLNLTKDQLSPRHERICKEALAKLAARMRNLRAELEPYAEQAMEIERETGASYWNDTFRLVKVTSAYGCYELLEMEVNNENCDIGPGGLLAIAWDEEHDDVCGGKPLTMVIDLFEGVRLIWTSEAQEMLPLS